jgi:hypothetical protein
VDGREREGKKQGKREMAPEQETPGEDKSERENREERRMVFPKDLCANTENCKGLSVKQNFPLI